MNIFEIKKEHKTTIVGFNGSGLPLGSRNDLDKLAELAHVNKNLAQYFVKLPTKEQIAAYRAGEIVAAIEEQTAGAADSTKEQEQPAVSEEQSTDGSLQQQPTEEPTPTTEKKRGNKVSKENK